MFQFDGYTLDVAHSSLRAADREIPLRPKSFEVLRYLVENADRLVTKDELIKAIWPDVIVTDDALVHCVSEARQAIADSKQTLIATVPRRGYRFTAPVLRIAGKAAEGAPSPIVGEGRGREARVPTVRHSRTATADQSPQGGGEQAGVGASLDRPPSRCFPSPISAATRSGTILATASPRTS